MYGLCTCMYDFKMVLLIIEYGKKLIINALQIIKKKLTGPASKNSKITDQDDWTSGIVLACP